MRELNPHVDLDRLKPGTTLLVPEAPDVKTGAGEPIDNNFFNAVAEEIAGGLKHQSQKMRTVLEARQAERDAMQSALKSAAVSRLVHSDRQLREQLKVADARGKADQKRAIEAEASLAEFRKLAVDEINRLKKIFNR